jgi:hypothetical protein
MGLVENPGGPATPSRRAPNAPPAVWWEIGAPEAFYVSGPLGLEPSVLCMTFPSSSAWPALGGAGA